jgi:DNA-binding NarL/FixJ family response regulator
MLDALFDGGFETIVRPTIEASISELRRHRFLALIVDCVGTDADPIEVVLNARDVAQDIPAIVVGDSDEPEEIAAAQALPHTVVLRSRTAGEIIRSVEKAAGMGDKIRGY